MPFPIPYFSPWSLMPKFLGFTLGMILLYGLIGSFVHVKLVRLWTQDPAIPYSPVIYWRIFYSLVIWLGWIYLSNNIHNLSPVFDYILGFSLMLLIPILMEIIAFKLLIHLERFKEISWAPWRIKVLVLSIPICVLSYLGSYGIMVLVNTIL
jgi:hypothetical protein